MASQNLTLMLMKVTPFIISNWFLAFPCPNTENPVLNTSRNLAGLFVSFCDRLRLTL